MLIVVIAVFEMPLGIPGTARHGTYRQHEPTLALFEFAMQQLLRPCRPDCCANAAAYRASSAPGLPVLRSAQPESARVVLAESSEERSHCARSEDRHHP